MNIEHAMPPSKAFPMRAYILSQACLLPLILAACSTNAQTANRPPTKRVKVVASYPHDAAAFTQGLVVEGTTIFESTGQYGNSSIRKVDLASGEISLSLPLKPDLFGEGITIMGDNLYLLTWKARACHLFDKNTLQWKKSFSYTGEGWGLANDGKFIYMSDGTSTIRVVDPETFKVVRRIRVKNGRRYLSKLNELEFVNGKIWANVWYDDRIAEIDPQTGKVTAWLDCRNVYPANRRPDREHVLNGIAVDNKSGRIYVTGKNWPQLYEIELVPSTP